MASKFFYKSNPAGLLERAQMLINARVPAVRSTDPSMFNKRPAGPQPPPNWMKAMAKTSQLPLPKRTAPPSVSHETYNLRIRRAFEKRHPELCGIVSTQPDICESFCAHQAVIMSKLRRFNPERLVGLTEEQRFQRLFEESYTLTRAQGTWDQAFKMAKSAFSYTPDNALFDEYLKVAQRDKERPLRTPRAFRVLRNELELAKTKRAEDATWRLTALKLRQLKFAAVKKKALETGAAKET